MCQYDNIGQTITALWGYGVYPELVEGCLPSIRGTLEVRGSLFTIYTEVLSIEQYCQLPQLKLLNLDSIAQHHLK